MIQNIRYFLLLHLIVFIWGFTGILGKLIDLSPISIVWFRVLIASLSLGAYMVFRKKSFKINRIQILKLFIIGSFVVAHWITFYFSIQMSTASLGILCLSTATLHVTWLEPLIMGKRFSWIEFVFGILVIYGIYFVSGSFNEKEMWALLIGLVSALFAASFAVFNAKLAQEMTTQIITFYEMFFGVILISIFVSLNQGWTEDFYRMEADDFLLLLFLGIVCTSFAFLVTIEIVKRLGAFTVSLSINLEPIYTILLAIPILSEHEMLNSQFYIGAAMIIAVVIANGILKYYLAVKERIKNQITNGVY